MSFSNFDGDGSLHSTYAKCHRRVFALGGVYKLNFGLNFHFMEVQNHNDHLWTINQGDVLGRLEDDIKELKTPPKSVPEEYEGPPVAKTNYHNIKYTSYVRIINSQIDVLRKESAQRNDGEWVVNQLQHLDAIKSSLASLQPAGTEVLDPSLPDFLQDLYERSIKEVDEGNALKIKQMLIKHTKAFSQGKTDIGRINNTYHTIRFKLDEEGRKPIPYRDAAIRYGPAGEALINEHLADMWSADVIEHSESDFAAAVVIVDKKDGATRFCVDYRGLNAITKKDCWPLPRIDDMLRKLSNGKYFAVLDLASGYWQIRLDPEDKHKTAFITHKGLYQFKILPFGLCNAPSTFCRYMEKLMRDIDPKTAMNYLDDIIVMGQSPDDLVANMSNVLRRLEETGMKLKPKKCEMFKTKVAFLGHIVSAKGIEMDPKKIEALVEWPTPTCVKEVKSFIGACSYYRAHIKNFSDIVRPLHLFQNKRERFVWSPEAEKSFKLLQIAMTTGVMLAYPDWEKPFMLDTDASDRAMGASLSQNIDGEEKVVGYYTKCFSGSQQNYCTTKRELLAVVLSFEHWEHYLRGSKIPFTLRTDHEALTFLYSMKKVRGILARWIQRMQGFHYIAKHRPGDQHINADALSRRPCPKDCKSCYYGQLKDPLEIDDEEYENVDIESPLDLPPKLVAISTSRDWKDIQSNDVILQWLRKNKQEDYALSDKCFS